MEKINHSTPQLLQALIHTGPYVRFAWGLSTDSLLNHHPAQDKNNRKPPAGRAFDPAKPALYMRLERQTIHGFPGIRCMLFTIRTYFYDVRHLVVNPRYKKNLLDAINTMSASSLEYKGLLHDRDNILQWLADLSGVGWEKPK